MTSNTAEITASPTLLAQGDILLRPMGDFLSKRVKHIDSTDDGDIILAHGELSGHSHVLRGKGASRHHDWEAFQLLPPGLYLGTIKVTRPVELVHDEHRTITLAPGTYIVSRQRELSARADWELGHVAD